MSVRTRFAPSPTGYLHVGGARTALFNYLFARKHGGTFVLRVEDTDEARNTQAARDAIFTGMHWLGLDWDEGEGKGGDYGPYNQSERTAIYDKWFEVLREKGRVYEEEGAWRFRFERKPITMNDLVCGEVTIDYRDESNTPDMVIRRSDGSYVFHFVNVVDDLEMKITHVIRGEDHLMNTPKHLQLFEALGAPAPQYAHIPLILNADGSKMSKRDVGAAVGDYPRQGFIAPGVINFIALLGWSSKSDEEIFTLEELVARFSLEAVNRAPARFDVEKCAWVNQQHLARLSRNEFFAQFNRNNEYILEQDENPRMLRILKQIGEIGDQVKAHLLIKELQKKIRVFNDIPGVVDFLLDDTFDLDPEAVEKVRGNAAAKDLLAALANDFAALSDWSADAAKHQIGETAKAAGAKPGQLMFPVRVALSGKSGGPDLGDILGLLGQEKCVARLQAFAGSL